MNKKIYTTKLRKEFVDLRNKYNLTVGQIDKILGYKSCGQFTSNYENGRTSFPIKNFAKIIEFLKNNYGVSDSVLRKIRDKLLKAYLQDMQDKFLAEVFK